MKFDFYDDDALRAQLSGERFCVTYRVLGDEQEARERAESMCVEQTVEFPAAHIECPAIQSDILGRIESFAPAGEGVWRVVLSYADEIAGEELPQLLNVAFGNSSILPGIILERLDPSPALLKLFPGPRFGARGLRERLGVFDRPLTFTAVKPLGLPPKALAEEAYRCALGGVDLIKDDHRLANQRFAAYRERVEQVSAAVRRANEETGGHTAYIPNVTGPFRDMADRLTLAEDCGAGGVMLLPGLSGFDVVDYAARTTGLPVVVHPAFLGASLDRGAGGVDCGCLFGQLPRLAGADVTVFPNFGGRFSLSTEQCGNIRDMCAEPLGGMRTTVPAPAGGMTMDKVGAMGEFYGPDVALLMGGGLFTRPGSLDENCRVFTQTAQAAGR